MALAVLLLLLGTLRGEANHELRLECLVQWRTALQVHQCLRHVDPRLI